MCSAKWQCIVQLEMCCQRYVSKVISVILLIHGKVHLSRYLFICLLTSVMFSSALTGTVQNSDASCVQ